MIREGLDTLARAAAESPVPLVIYPEGTRTKDGLIGRFKRRGLRAILQARDWEVWTITVDGYWECAKLADFRAAVSSIDGRMRVDGPFEAPAPGAEPEAVDGFIDEMEQKMAGFLSALREEPAA
jgi:1-acyl-sn-glycerol-3-phosphate acyltransferase